MSPRSSHLLAVLVLVCLLGSSRAHVTNGCQCVVEYTTRLYDNLQAIISLPHSRVCENLERFTNAMDNCEWSCGDIAASKELREARGLAIQYAEIYPCEVSYRTVSHLELAWRIQLSKFNILLLSTLTLTTVIMLGYVLCRTCGTPREGQKDADSERAREIRYALLSEVEKVV